MVMMLESNGYSYLVEIQDLREFGFDILAFSVILHLFEDVHPVVVMVLK
jgi:hypothetical protein